MKGIYIKIFNQTDSRFSPMRVSAIMLHDSSPLSDRKGVTPNQWIKIEKEPELEGNRFHFIRCFHCRHEDFSSGGAAINEYQCNGCDMSMSATEHNKNHLSGLTYTNALLPAA